MILTTIECTIDNENKKYLYDYYLFSNSTSAAAEYAHVSSNINVINAKTT